MVMHHLTNHGIEALSLLSPDARHASTRTDRPVSVARVFNIHWRSLRFGCDTWIHIPGARCRPASQGHLHPYPLPTRHPLFRTIGPNDGLVGARTGHARAGRLSARYRKNPHAGLRAPETRTIV